MSAKPVTDEKVITEELRNYHKKNWKKAIESNPHFEIIGLDAILISTKVEKEVIDKSRRDPRIYDLMCSMITTLLKFVSSWVTAGDQPEDLEYGAQKPQL